MLIFLLIVYVGVLLALVRLKFVRSSPLLWLSILPYTALLLIALFIPMQFAAPAGNIIVWHPVTQLASRVNGQVVKVNAPVNVVVEKDAPLATIDARPFQYEVDRLTAAKAEAEKQIESAAAKVESAKRKVEESKAAFDVSQQAVKKAEADLKLAESEATRETNLFAKNATSKLDLEKAQRGEQVAKAALPGAEARSRQADAAIAEAQAEVRHAEADLSAAPLKVQQLQNQLQTARYNLDQCVVRAPSRGRVVNLQVQEGTSMSVGMPMLTFIPEGTSYLTISVQENFLRDVKPGQPVEIAARFYPGEVLRGKVEAIIPLTGEGQLSATEPLPEVANLKSQGKFAVRVALDPESASRELPIGSGGTAAIFTESARPTHIIRRVILRQQTWLNYLF